MSVCKDCFFLERFNFSRGDSFNLLDGEVGPYVLKQIKGVDLRVLVFFHLQIFTQSLFVQC